MKWTIALIVLASCSSKTARDSERLDKLDQFCIATRNAIRSDRRAFEGDDPLKREAAYERFYDGHVMYHNVDSVLMCLDKVPKLPVGCDLKKNWRCLADVAREIEGALPPP